MDAESEAQKGVAAQAGGIGTQTQESSGSRALALNHQDLLPLGSRKKCREYTLLKTKGLYHISYSCYQKAQLPLQSAQCPSPWHMPIKQQAFNICLGEASRLHVSLSLCICTGDLYLKSLSTPI